MLQQVESLRGTNVVGGIEGEIAAQVHPFAYKNSTAQELGGMIVGESSIDSGRLECRAECSQGLFTADELCPLELLSRHRREARIQHCLFLPKASLA